VSCHINHHFVCGSYSLWKSFPGDFRRQRTRRDEIGEKTKANSGLFRRLGGVTIWPCFSNFTKKNVFNFPDSKGVFGLQLIWRWLSVEATTLRNKIHKCARDAITIHPSPTSSFHADRPPPPMYTKQQISEQGCEKNILDTKIEREFKQAGTFP